MIQILNIWVPFIGLLTSISLGIFVLKHNPRSWIFRSYSIYTLYLAILNLGLLGITPLYRAGMILLPLGFSQFVMNLVRRVSIPNKAILTIGYLFGGLLFLRDGVILPLDPSYNLFFGTLFLWSTSLLYQKGKGTYSQLERNRLFYIILALWIVILRLFLDVFSDLGWLVSPLWNMTLTIQPFLIAYAITRYKPMDFGTILRKTLLYSIISSIVVFFYFLLQRTFDDFLFYMTSRRYPFLSSLLGAISLAILIQGFGEPILNLLERTIFRKLYRRWQLVRKLNKTLSQIFDKDLFLGTILHTVTTLIDVKSSIIMLWNSEAKRYEVQFGIGIPSELRRETKFYKDTLLIKWLRENHEPILLEEVRDDPLFGGIRDEILGDLERIRARIIFPFLVNGELIGILGLSEKRDNDPYRWEEIRLIHRLCQEISGVLLSMTFYDRRIKEYINVIQAFVFSMEAKDADTKGHCERVANYAVAIGERLGLPPETLENIKLGGMIHDIGKITISDDILLKPGALSREEFEKIKRHPEAGIKILVPVQFSKEVIDSVLYHHERFSGTGYPEALKGEEIPLVARILAVADVYDAMTSHRKYRRALTKEEAKTELLRGAGKEYDAEIVRIFLSILDERGE